MICQAVHITFDCEKGMVSSFARSWEIIPINIFKEEIRMPIPFLVGLGAAAVGLLSIGGHESAKETNQKAQAIVNEAQTIFSEAKSSLETSQKATEAALLKLGTAKKDILDSSMAQFCKAYERVKDVQIKDSTGLNELSKFVIDGPGVLEVRKITNIYSQSIESGVAGAATGSLIALAASGTLPLVASTLSTAGSALAIGEVGVALGLTSSALSFAAAFTPLSAIAAPVMLFSAISADRKADENLEKAKAARSEARSKAEKMKTSQVLCDAITKRSDMLNDLLQKLNKMFTTCVQIMDRITARKAGAGGHVSSYMLTEDEVKLIAVTRSLAGAIKAIIDSPILTKDGSLCADSQALYEDTSRQLPSFSEKVSEVTRV